MDGSGSTREKRVRIQKGVKWEKGVGGGTLREKVLGFVWTNWLLYRIGRVGYLKIVINYCERLQKCLSKERERSLSAFRGTSLFA